MRTGIIIHSNTNNTLSVGERLLETMLCKGTNACLERVTADNEDPNAPQKVRLASAPDTGPYDVLLIGAPVHGFALSRAMDAYLKQLSGLKGKRVACFVTEQFPKPWMGGNRAVNQMARQVTALGYLSLASAWAAINPKRIRTEKTITLQG